MLCSVSFARGCICATCAHPSWPWRLSKTAAEALLSESFREARVHHAPTHTSVEGRLCNVLRAAEELERQVPVARRGRRASIAAVFQRRGSVASPVQKRASVASLWHKSLPSAVPTPSPGAPAVTSGPNQTDPLDGFAVAIGNGLFWLLPYLMYWASSTAIRSGLFDNGRLDVPHGRYFLDEHYPLANLFLT